MKNTKHEKTMILDQQHHGSINRFQSIKVPICFTNRLRVHFKFIKNIQIYE